MTNLKRAICVAFLFFSLSACAQERENDLEKKAVRMVENLKEIKKAKKHFKMTGSPLHVFFDGINGKDYYVKAAQIKGGRTFTYYWFLVDPRKNTIRYWDLPLDTSVTISQWRRNNYKIDPPEKKN